VDGESVFVEGMGGNQKSEASQRRAVSTNPRLQPRIICLDSNKFGISQIEKNN
jgi:hypothetical protein